MTETTQRATATIYQFPLKQRVAARALREAMPASVHGAALEAPQVAVCGAWYHEAAVLEAERVRLR